MIRSVLKAPDLQRKGAFTLKTNGYKTTHSGLPTHFTGAQINNSASFVKIY